MPFFRFAQELFALCGMISRIAGVQISHARFSTSRRPRQTAKPRPRGASRDRSMGICASCLERAYYSAGRRMSSRHLRLGQGRDFATHLKTAHSFCAPGYASRCGDRDAGLCLRGGAMPALYSHVDKMDYMHKIIIIFNTMVIFNRSFIRCQRCRPGASAGLASCLPLLNNHE